MMKISAPLITTALLVTACAQEPNPQAREAEDFAARIGNGAKTAAPPAAKAETPTPTAEQAISDSDRLESTAADAPAPACGSAKVAPFFGRKADAVTRDAVLAAVAPNTNVQFLDTVSDFTADPASTRLNVMIDVTGVIRSATCG